MGSTRSTMSSSGSNTSNEVQLYHEKQSQELCALHALNNLFQQKGKFMKKDLDEICLRLSPEAYFNPHKSFLGFGNYDVNVVMAALDDADYQTVWFDKRKDLSTLAVEHVFGFILNIPSNVKIGFVQLPFQRKHWIAVRQIEGVYYNLDSKLDKPKRIGTQDELLEYLREEIKSTEKQLLVVVEKSVTTELLWKTQNNSCDGQSGNGSDSATVPNTADNNS